MAYPVQKSLVLYLVLLVVVLLVLEFLYCA
jgi:hypothetical protein